MSSRSTFFLPIRVLSRLFRGKFIARLKAAHASGKLVFHGQLGYLSDPVAFRRWLRGAVDQDWVVYAKPPFGGPETVLKYLARYTHRVAITNSRLLSICDGRVVFRYKDYADGNRWKTMSLMGVEFIRRFLLHVLPRGFMRIRHYGFLANRLRQASLALCRQLLHAVTSATEPDPSASPCTRGVVCPECHRGRMIASRPLPARPGLSQLLEPSPAWNTS